MRILGVRQRRLLVVLVILVVVVGTYSWHRIRLTRLERDCRGAQLDRDWPALEQSAREWSRLDPQNAEAWIYLADGVQHQNRFLEASEYLQNVPSSSEKSNAVMLARAKILFGPANRPIEGARVMRQLLDSDADVEEAQNRLIEYYAITLQRSALRQQVRTAAKLGKEWPVAYVYYFLSNTLRMANGVDMNDLWRRSYLGQEGRYPEAGELFVVGKTLHMDDKDIGIGTPPEAEMGAEKSKVAVDTSDKKAIPPTRSEKDRQVAELLVRFPNNINLLANEIELDVAFGDTEKVVRLLDQAPSQADEDNRFWRFKGWVHFSDGDYDEAEKAYRRSLELFPLDWYTLQRLAEVLRAKGDLKEAAKWQELVTLANALRVRIRKLKAIETVTPEILTELAKFMDGCGDEELAGALRRRIASMPGRDHLPTRRSN